MLGAASKKSGTLLAKATSSTRTAVEFDSGMGSTTS
jgi:hypothetical protein